jgi:cytochrome c-type biogenesis protein CcmH/NrfF
MLTLLINLILWIIPIIILWFTVIRWVIYYINCQCEITTSYEKYGWASFKEFKREFDEIQWGVKDDWLYSKQEYSPVHYALNSEYLTWDSLYDNPFEIDKEHIHKKVLNRYSNVIVGNKFKFDCKLMFMRTPVDLILANWYTNIVFRKDAKEKKKIKEEERKALRIENQIESENERIRQKKRVYKW